jgi:hypothetical protein
MPDRRQADKLNAGGELIGNCGGYGKSQARLSGTTRTGESQKPNVKRPVGAATPLRLPGAALVQ